MAALANECGLLAEARRVRGHLPDVRRRFAQLQAERIIPRFPTGADA
jgi:hypothetical protein